MKRCISVLLAVFIAACVFVGSEKQAWAYIDPGSGLLTLQAASSAVAACAYFLRRRILALFAANKPAQTTSQDVPTRSGSHEIA
jgi:hypothetical protein